MVKTQIKDFKDQTTIWKNLMEYLYRLVIGFKIKRNGVVATSKNLIDIFLDQFLLCNNK
jgi:hypothetical protein